MQDLLLNLHLLAKIAWTQAKEAPLQTICACSYERLAMMLTS